MIIALLLACGRDFTDSLRGDWVGSADFGDGIPWSARLLDGDFRGTLVPRYEYQGTTQVWGGVFELWTPDATASISGSYVANVCESDEGCIWNQVEVAQHALLLTSESTGGYVYLVGTYDDDAIVGDFTWNSTSGTGNVPDLTLTRSSIELLVGTPP